MLKRIIPFSPPDITQSEIDAVCEVLRSGWITTGPKTKEFEKRLASYCGAERVVCLSSATAALELNLRVLGIGEGDEVIVPAYTYTATASPVLHVGAKLVMVDISPNSTEPDYTQIAQAITEKTKAIVLVDIGGVLCDYNKALEIAKEKSGLFVPANKIQKAMGRIAVISDAAHSLGAKNSDGMSGSLADFTSFSFHAVKNLTTAEGGAATWRTIEGIDNDEIYKEYQLLSLHGQSKDALLKTDKGSWEYDVVGAYYKCNMTDITASMGLTQLERYEKTLARRFEIIEKYNKLCDSLSVEYLPHKTDSKSSSGHLYITRIPGISTEQRNEIIDEMAALGVTCNVHFKPLPMFTAYKNLGFDIKDYPNAYDYFKNVVTLPLYTKLTDDDVDYIIECFEKVVKKYI